MPDQFTEILDPVLPFAAEILPYISESIFLLESGQDDEFRLKAFNQSFLRSIELEMEKMIDLEIRQIPSPFFAKLNSFLKEKKESKGVLHFEEPHASPYGIHNWEVTLLAFPSKEANIRQIVGIRQDWYENRAGKEGKKEIGLLFPNTLAENTLEMIGLFDPKGNILFANTAFEKTMGLISSEVPGKSILDFCNPEDRPLLEDFLAQAASGISGEGKIVLPYTTSEGHQHWISLKAWLIPNQTSQPEKILLVGQDITERKIVEGESGRKERLLQATARATRFLLTESILEKGMELALRELGLATERDRIYVFEFHKEACTGNDLMSQRFEWVKEGITPQMGNQELQNIPLQLAAPRWLEELSHGRHIKGNVRDFPDSEREALEPQQIVSLLVVPIIVEEICWGFVGFDDCFAESNWSEAEESILMATASAFGMAIIRNRRNIELIQAKIQAEESDKLKTAFLNNISHEIRTPLNGILGFADIIIEPQLTDSDKKRYLQILQQNGTRLLNTINDFMDISLLVSKNYRIHSDTFLIPSLMKDLEQMYRVPCQEKGLDFRVQLADSIPLTPITGDPSGLKRILGHLLDNAIKFTPDGTIEFGVMLTPHGYQYYVKDTGIGISPQAQKKVFDPFQQENIDTHRGFEGSGLGLSIAKGIAELLGGSLSVQSEKERGSVFFLDIPFEPNLLTRNPLSSPVYSLTKNGRPSVLIAEDDEVSFLLLEILFSRASYQVIRAVNGAEAIEICRTNPSLSLVLMDIKMPVLNGLEATKIIKGMNPGIPIVAVTAYALTGDRESALDAGCDDYFSKPIVREEINKIIQKYAV